MMLAAASNSTGMPPAAGKKPRKPYKITRPREKWAADEHERFLHALLLFGRDWKSIEQFVTTKTATQIRSHAQKYFLKAQKLGIAGALPPPQLRRGAALSQYHPCSNSNPDGNAAAPVYPLPPTYTSPPPPVNSVDFTAPQSSAQQSADWACATAGVHHQYYWPTSCGSEPSDASRVAEAMLPEDDTIQLPLSPGDPRFAQVYRFVGDVFGTSALWPVEAQLQRLRGEDPAVVATILLVLRNVGDNLFA